MVVSRRKRFAGTYCSTTCFPLLLLFCSARDTLTYDNPLRDDGPSSNSTLVSAGGKFELGFFNPAPVKSSGNRRYVGIWYHKQNPKTVVWVANRNVPVVVNSSISGVFAIKEGNLQVFDNMSTKSYWSTGLATSKSMNLLVKLLDSGNLVLTDVDDEDDELAVRYIWESFQNPTDTFIPGMVMDTSMQLSSWRDVDDPGIGNFTFKRDQVGDSGQFIILQKSIPYWKSEEPGMFSSSAEMPLVMDVFLSNFTSTNNDSNHFYKPINTTRSGNNYTRMVMNFTGELQFRRIVINFTGKLQFQTWIEDTKQWNLIWSEPRDRCSVFNACGNFGSCTNDNWPLVCNCLPGFRPRFVEKWEAGEFSDGCLRESTICSTDNDTFLSLKMVKVSKPVSQINVMNETACRDECLSSCQCQAYSYSAAVNSAGQDFRPDPLCSTWLEGLSNLVEKENGDKIFNLSVRVDKPALGSTVRNCKVCGTFMIPYPLSTEPDCGDPMYYRFNCDTVTGQLSLVGLNGNLFRVIRINRSKQRFIIQVRNWDNCDPRNRITNQQLNLSPPFTVINWCIADLGKFGSEVSSQAANAVELGWELPPEPTCKESADCTDSPHSTCTPDKGGKKRCHCNPNFQWNRLNSTCTHQGGAIQQAHEKKSRQRMPTSLIVIVVSVLTSVIFLACIGFTYIWRRKVNKRQDKINRAQLDSERRVQDQLMDTGEFKDEDEKGIDVPFIDFQSILEATDHFSNSNKLGQGGYGPVYKGTFLGGNEIAVKRLSRVSGQGLQEFKNEVVLIAKLQHRNLVRLKGYCIKGEEKILLYEYMPNKSLDSVIFDDTKSMILNWEMRFNIILGIARGLLYLHQDSRLRIIHRDLKTSNILLDEEMNPKISDFGLARIVGGKQTESNTNTVVGTYGYMSPEYALDGTFSVKSDVFSFGVVLLEIISGKKNTGFYQSKQTFSLINYAWSLWTENKVLDLKDKNLDESCKESEFIKCVNVGLLCVQEDPSARPTMSSAITMLDSENAIPPTPKQPAFLIGRGNNRPSAASSSSSNKLDTFSEITMSTTLRHGR